MGAGMRTLGSRRLRTIRLALLLICTWQTSLAFARGSQVAHDDPWNAEHISQLPTEIRNAVNRMCGEPPRAAHYFATYFQNSQLIKLHFEHFRCDEKTFCTGAGCLHQEYISTGRHYRLLRSYYGRNDD